MKTSRNWLQDYFEKELPDAETLAETLIFRAFEIESVKEVADDFVIDIDVLPNRSSDCLSHRGIARELATLLDLKLKDDPLKRSVTSSPDSNLLEVNIQNPELVNRFSAVVIEGVEVGESPDWLKKRLEAMGQKPINNVVDATNVVMLDIGQPLHAFDRDKLTKRDGGYAIAVRAGKAGEKIVTLADEEYEVGPENLLIVDGSSDAPIGIAGVKGGKGTEVDEGTTNLVIEAANFNYVSVRRTAQALRLWTDASVRFQNQPSPELTLHALREMVRLLREMAGGEVEGYADWYPAPRAPKPVSVTVSEANGLLGTALAEKDIDDIFKRFDFVYRREEDRFVVEPPFERTDLTIKEDLIEEIARVYGYEHVAAAALPLASGKPAVNKRFYYAEKVRRLLVELGFSEVYTYTLRSAGEVELLNPVAKDRPFVRSNLSDGLRESLEFNARNAELLGLDEVRIFEIGTVFEKDAEHVSLALGVCAGKGKAAEHALNEALAGLAARLEVRLPSGRAEDGVWEIDFTELLDKLPAPNSYDISYEFGTLKERKFQSVSPYPFVLRDLAVWVPQEIKDQKSNIKKVIIETAGPLLVRADLFDEFEKEERTSYAFHLVFQSYEKTLSDEEVNKVMEKISSALAAKGWEVR